MQSEKGGPDGRICVACKIKKIMVRTSLPASIQSLAQTTETLGEEKKCRPDNDQLNILHGSLVKVTSASACRMIGHWGLGKSKSPENNIRSNLENTH